MRGHCLLLASVVLAACAGSAAVAPAPSPSAPTPHERDGAQARRPVEAPAEGTRDAFPPELAAPLRTGARALALGPFAWPNNGLSVLTRSDLAFHLAWKRGDKIGAIAGLPGGAPPVGAIQRDVNGDGSQELVVFLGPPA